MVQFHSIIHFPRNLLCLDMKWNLILTSRGLLSSNLWNKLYFLLEIIGILIGNLLETTTVCILSKMIELFWGEWTRIWLFWWKVSYQLPIFFTNSVIFSEKTQFICA